MKVSVIILGVLIACVVSLAAEHGPLLTALQPRSQPETDLVYVYAIQPAQVREKRDLLLGGVLLGAGIIGAGVVGAGLLGAGILGAKAGLVGGAVLADHALHYGRGYGSYGYGYGDHGHSGGGGYATYSHSSKVNYKL